MGMEPIFDRQFNPNRYALVEKFLQRPALNAVLDFGTPTNAEVIAGHVANQNFEVSGTNMTTALCTFSTSGGITLTTAGASNDQALLGVHTNTNQTAWGKAGLWGSENSTRFETIIKTGSSIAAATIIAGLKLTSTPVIATDADQVYFRYEPSENGGAWQFIHSRSDTDTTTVAPTSVIPVVAASTFYRLIVDIDADRKVQAYIGTGINGTPIPVTANKLAALTDAIDFYPFIGVQATAAAAKAIDVKYLECSRLIN